MASVLYAKDGKICTNTYMEIYVPLDYFNGNFAINKGSSIETIGLLFTRAYTNGVEGPIRLINIPSVIEIMLYEFQQEEIRINGKLIKVLTLKYLKDSYVLHQTVQKGREIAETFLNSMLMGKLPACLNYTKIIDIWWRNLDIAGVSYKIPSKIYEMIIANIYRSQSNVKVRYGQVYGKQDNPSGYDYKSGNVRKVVSGLSTFSGMVFEDINSMITVGINNSIAGVDEPVSPLEKVIHY